MKFRLIDANKADMPVDRVCTLLDVSVSGYYAWKKRAPSQRQLDDFVLLAHIRAQFALSNETYGAPRMHVEIREDGVQAGRHRIARLMRANGLKATQRRRFRKTTDSHHGCPVAANILDQNFACDGQDQKWGVDISYIWTAEGWLYLAIVLDLFSRRIIGWAVSDRLKKDLALNALRRAITIRQPSAGLIHHSDRGSQYCSGDYQKLLGCRGIIASMSGPENAGTNKGELLRQRRGGNRLQNHQIRSGLADKIPDKGGCRIGPWPLH